MTSEQKQPISVKWVDNHCHIENSPAGRNAIAEANHAGVEKLVNVGIKDT